MEMALFESTFFLAARNAPFETILAGIWDKGSALYELYEKVSRSRSIRNHDGVRLLPLEMKVVVLLVLVAT